MRQFFRQWVGKITEKFTCRCSRQRSLLTCTILLLILYCNPVRHDMPTCPYHGHETTPNYWRDGTRSASNTCIQHLIASEIPSGNSFENAVAHTERTKSVTTDKTCLSMHMSFVCHRIFGIFIFTCTAKLMDGYTSCNESITPASHSYPSPLKHTANLPRSRTDHNAR